MKDFAKKHPVNSSKRKTPSASLRAKRQLDQPIKLKHFFLIGGMAALLLLAANLILKTDVKNLRGHVANPTVEISYPTDLEQDSIFIELDGIVTAENCEYRLQIETYGKRIYAQEQLGAMLTFGLEAYVEKTFSASMPGKTLFRVMSGPYETKSEVNNAREVLIKNNRQPLILKTCIKT